MVNSHLRLLALEKTDGATEAEVRAIDEVVYEGAFDTPKTDASVRPIPLSDTAIRLLGDWRKRVRRTAPDDRMFATVSG